MKTYIHIGISILLLFGAMSQEMLAQIDSPHQATTIIGKITIVRTGFLSKDTTIIRYHRVSLNIVEVINNGDTVPESSFYRYEDNVRNALESNRVREMMPGLDELEKHLDSPEFSDSAKLVELERVLNTMDLMKSNYASIRVSILRMRLNILRDRNMRDEIRKELEKHGYAPANGVKTLKISQDMCEIDGATLQDDLAMKVKKIFEKYRERMIPENEETEIIFDD